MQSLDVIPPHTCMALERALHSRSSNRVNTFENKPRCLLQSQLATSKEISTAGEQALVILYNGTPVESLDSLRYKCFYEKVSMNTSCIHPQTLPPTLAAAKYHSLHVYFQILEWKGSGDKIRPLDWGWKKSDGKLMPYSLTCHQLQMNFWKWSGVTVTLTAAVWGAHARYTIWNVLLVATAEGHAALTQTIPHMRMKMI